MLRQFRNRLSRPHVAETDQLSLGDRHQAELSLMMVQAAIILSADMTRHFAATAHKAHAENAALFNREMAVRVRDISSSSFNNEAQKGIQRFIVQYRSWKPAAQMWAIQAWLDYLKKLWQQSSDNLRSQPWPLSEEIGLEPLQGMSLFFDGDLLIKVGQHFKSIEPTDEKLQDPDGQRAGLMAAILMATYRLHVLVGVDEAGIKVAE